MNLTEEEKKIQQERAARYGDSVRGHQNLGRIWAALLSQYCGIYLDDIPADIVLLMFAASKLNRASVEPPDSNSENFDDGKIYIELAKEARKIDESRRV